MMSSMLYTYGDAAVNQRQHQHRYLKELGLSLALYFALLVAALWLGKNMAPGALRTALYLSPMLAFLLALRAVVRQIRRSDEFIRKTTLEHLAIAAAVTAGCTFTYGFLEIAGFPKLSMFVVWPLMATAWVGTTAIDYVRNR